MLFEDVHWADPTTLEVIDLLIHRVRNIPLLVVLTHRPEFSSRWSHYGHVAALTLIEAHPAAERVRWYRGWPAARRCPRTCSNRSSTKTDGVPLFVEELTKSILELGDLREAGDRWEYAGRAGSLAIPLTLRDSLMARLDRFAPVKEIAQIGAAIGREFSYELIAAVAPHSQSPSWTRRWRSSRNQGWRSSRARRPMRSTPSSTRWCRTPPTTRCSGAAGRNCTARSPG